MNVILMVETFVAFILAVTIHGAAQARVATLLGDTTPRLRGRLSLLPQQQLSAIGIIAGIVFSVTTVGAGIGWGKPLEIDARKLRIGPNIGTIVVALSGLVFNLLTMAGLYVVHFLAIMLAIVATVDAVSGEIGSHTIQSLVTKPLRRWQVIAGKWLGYVAMLLLFTAALCVGVLLESRFIAGYVPPNPVPGVLLILVQVAVPSVDALHSFLMDRFSARREIVGFRSSVIYQHVRKPVIEPIG